MQPAIFTTVNMKLLKNNNQIQLLDALCQSLHKRKFKEAEKELLNFIEETLHNSKNSVKKEDKKNICQTIYCSFNIYYLKWLKKNKINIERERNEIISSEHSNYLISCCKKIEEMDDLLFDLVHYLDSVIDKDEVAYGLDCYKK